MERQDAVDPGPASRLVVHRLRWTVLGVALFAAGVAVALLLDAAAVGLVLVLGGAFLYILVALAGAEVPDRYGSRPVGPEDFSFDGGGGGGGE